MDIIRGRSARRRPHSSSRGVRPSTGARRSWARDAGGVARPDGTVRRRPSTAPTGGRGRHALVRPGSADSKQLRELYKGVNVGRGPRPVTAGGKVDAHILVKSLDSVEHTEEQLKAMRRIMQLCDPKPSSKLAAANCRALANAGGIPVLVRLLTCGATQLEWGAVLSLGSIAAFDNSTNAGSKHEIRQHGGLGQPPPLAHGRPIAGTYLSHTDAPAVCCQATSWRCSGTARSGCRSSLPAPSQTWRTTPGRSTARCSRRSPRRSEILTEI